MATFTLTDLNDIFPQPGNDITGNDVIFAGGGNDSVDAGAGDDLVEGGVGRDTLRGGSGDDTLTALSPGNDSLDGGTGIDTVVLDFTPLGALDVRAVMLANVWRILLDGSSATLLDAVERLDIRTGDGNDFIGGGNLNDTISSGGGNDTVRGGAGDDTVLKTFGHYDLDGGAGTDRLNVSDTRPVDAGAGMVFDARFSSGSISVGTQTTGTFRNFEYFNVSGTTVNDLIILGNAAAEPYDGDVAEGLGGDDTLAGGDGGDVLFGGNYLFSGGSGSGSDVLYGEDGDDRLFTGGPDAGVTRLTDAAYGGNGDDFIGTDEVGGLGVIYNYSGAIFDGGAGNDTLRIGVHLSDADITRATITGIEEFVFIPDRVFLPTVWPNSPYRVRMTAEQMNGFADMIVVGTVALANNATVNMDGRLQVNTLQLAVGGQRVDLSATTDNPGFTTGTNILGNTGNDHITGTVRNETLAGNNGNDTLRGIAGRDTLFGGNGDDVMYAGVGPGALHGDAGNDSLLGGAGENLLYGGAGRDVQTGYGGPDQFIYLSVLDSGVSTAARDTIVDFTISPATGAGFVDRINLAAIDARAATQTDDAFLFIGAASFTAEGQIRAVQSGANTVLYLNIAGSGVAEMSILLLNENAGLLSAADFVL